MQFYDNDTKAISVSEDEVIKIWDLENKKELVSLYPIGENEIAVITPEGLFDASPEAMNKMYFVQGTEIIELTQLKDRYYEPGLLQKIMNNENIREVPDMEYLDLYPEIELSEIHYGEFGVFLTNQGGGIGRVQIFINGKEITADARPADADPNAEKMTIIYTIANHPYLNPNITNRITVKVYNAEGWLVSRPVHGYYIPERGKAAEPHLYILSIGVSDYSNDDLDLRFAHKDAIDMATALQLGGNGLFGEENTHTYLLTSPICTQNLQGFENLEDFLTLDTAILSSKQNIINTFEHIARKATSSDIIVVYMAGHGMNIGGAEGDFHYITQDAYTTQFTDPAIIEQTTLSTTEFVELMKKVPALKQVLIIDACHSGRVAENLMAFRDGDDESSRIRALDRMKDRTGMHIIAGSQANAVSYESNKFGQGILTYSLLEGMKGSALKEGKFIDVNLLFQNSRDRVPDLARGINGYQIPVLFSPYGTESFDIGKLTMEDKTKIPLAKSKSIFIESRFQDAATFSDILLLENSVNDKLREISSSGKKTPLIFIEANEFPDAYQFRRQYTISGEQISLKATKVAVPKQINLQVHWTCDFSRFGTATLVADNRVLLMLYVYHIINLLILFKKQK